MVFKDMQDIKNSSRERKDINSVEEMSINK